MLLCKKEQFIYLIACISGKKKVPLHLDLQNYINNN